MHCVVNYYLFSFSNKMPQLWQQYVKQEKQFVFGCALDFLRSKHPKLTQNSLSHVVNFLYDLVEKLSLEKQVFFASTLTFYRYICSPLVKSLMKFDLDCIAVACCWMAHAMFDSNTLPLTDFYRACNTYYSGNLIQKTAILIVKALDANIYTVPNILTFLQILEKENDDKAMAFAECATLFFELCANHRQSTIAKACVLMSLGVCGDIGKEDENAVRCACELQKLIIAKRDAPSMKPVLTRFPFLSSHVFFDFDCNSNGSFHNAREDTKKPTNNSLVSEKYFENVYTERKKIGAGAYGGVYECYSNAIVGLDVAVKKYHENGLTSSALREMGLLSSLNHENVVRATSIFIERSLIRIVMPMSGQADLSTFIENNKNNGIARGVQRKLMYDVCQGLNYLHKNRVMHRDLKPGNIVIDVKKQKATIVDLGISRLTKECVTQDDVVVDTHANVNFTTLVCSLPYRATEIMLGDAKYDGFAVDMWSFGCTLGEIALCRCLTNVMTYSEFAQLIEYFKLLGTPTDESLPNLLQMPHWNTEWPKFMFGKYYKDRWDHMRQSIGERGCNLLLKMLHYDKRKRITAKEALKDAFFLDQLSPEDEKISLPRHIDLEEQEEEEKRLQEIREKESLQEIREKAKSK